MGFNPMMDVTLCLLKRLNQYWPKLLSFVPLSGILQCYPSLDVVVLCTKYE